MATKEKAIAYHTQCDVVFQGTDDKNCIQNGPDRRAVASHTTIDSARQAGWQTKKCGYAGGTECYLLCGPYWMLLGDATP